MANTFRQIGLGKGSSILIETDEPAEKSEGTGRGNIGMIGSGGSTKKVIDEAADIGDDLACFCSQLVSTMSSLPSETRPAEVEFSFGIHLSGEGNLKIVKLSGDATLQVKSVWKAPAK